MSHSGSDVVRAAAEVERDEAAIRIWLFAVAGLVLAMVIVGGATRLTESGLSITEWQPILGAIPPLTEAQWLAAFEKYKQIAQYHLMNKGMSLEAFKFIYYWEWAHRLLGRFIGIAFAVPFIFFWATGRLKTGLAPRLLGVLALGGLQGFIGWFMVQSGLVGQRVNVSHYRLALHLGMAFAILGALLWVAFGLGDRRGARARAAEAGDRGVAWALMALVFVQVILGAFVAGLRAGLAHNTWPLMDGQLIPTGLGVMTPWYMNIFENAMAVQFNHRMLAYALLALAVWHWWKLSNAQMGAVADRAGLLALAMLAQAALGIWTLLAHVPLSLGLLHQGGAAVVFGIAVWHLHGIAAARAG